METKDPGNGKRKRLMPEGFELARVAGDGLSASSSKSTQDQPGGRAVAIAVSFSGQEGEVTESTLTVAY